MASKKQKTKNIPHIVSDESFFKKTQHLLLAPYVITKRRVKGLLGRRPHRSFKRTLRRDYVRPMHLPGYWAFTNSVRKLLLQNKKLFFGLIFLYGTLTVMLIGLGSQDVYTELSDTLRETGSEIMGGDLGQVGQAGLLLATALSGTLNSTPTDLQRMFAIILALLIWLTTVWLLRARLAGRKPKLRDGLYNAAAPFLSTFLVGFVLMLQMLPVVLAVVAFGAAISSGLLEGGVEAMVFWAAASLLTTLSLYWISSTFIALVVVTLPGMYPMQAIRTAGDLVIGRRIRILLRLLWLVIITLVLWALIMIPFILIDAWIKDTWPATEWIPAVPVALLVMSSITVVWASSYTYLLYRRIVDDDTAPA